jgi:hypothetical protein
VQREIRLAGGASTRVPLRIATAGRRGAFLIFAAARTPNGTELARCFVEMDVQPEITVHPTFLPVDPDSGHAEVAVYSMSLDPPTYLTVRLEQASGEVRVVRENRRAWSPLVVDATGRTRARAFPAPASDPATRRRCWVLLESAGLGSPGGFHLSPIGSNVAVVEDPADAGVGASWILLEYDRATAGTEVRIEGAAGASPVVGRVRLP